MAEIRDYVGDFSFGGPALPGLTGGSRKSASAEVPLSVAEFPHG